MIKSANKRERPGSIGVFYPRCDRNEHSSLDTPVCLSPLLLLLWLRLVLFRPETKHFLRLFLWAFACQNHSASLVT